MTIADVLIIGGLCLAIRMFFRTHGGKRHNRPNWGLLMALFGLTLTGTHYVIHLAGMHVLPLFMPEAAAWSVMRSLNLNGYWLMIGPGLLFLVCGLHLLNREPGSTAGQGTAHRSDPDRTIIGFPSPTHLPILQIEAASPPPFAGENRSSAG